MTARLTPHQRLVLRLVVEREDAYRKREGATGAFPYYVNLYVDRLDDGTEFYLSKSLMLEDALRTFFALERRGLLQRGPSERFWYATDAGRAAIVP